MLGNVRCAGRAAFRRSWSSEEDPALGGQATIAFATVHTLRISGPRLRPAQPSPALPPPCVIGRPQCLAHQPIGTKAAGASAWAWGQRSPMMAAPSSSRGVRRGMERAAGPRLGRRLSFGPEAGAMDGGRALAEPAGGGRARGPIAHGRSDSHEVHRVQDFNEQVFQTKESCLCGARSSEGAWESVPWKPRTSRGGGTACPGSHGPSRARLCRDRARVCPCARTGRSISVKPGF
nr:uncharacterized protein LOC123276931 isoform X2 [Equus asinus]